jgi:hypothetical protein
MSLPLTEECVYSVSDTSDEEQVTFNRFGVESQESLIAVVSRPTKKIQRVTDEIMPALGMPDTWLEKYLQKRSQYRLNDGITEPGDMAYTDLELDSRYREYVQESSEAQACIDEIISRLESGEHITLVCFEESGKKCHRHVLLRMIRERAESQFDFTESVVV